MRFVWTIVASVVGVAFCSATRIAIGAEPVTIRVATFNLEDVRTDDLKDAAQPRLRRLAEIIQRLRPNVILLNELAYDMPGAPGFRDGDTPGQNAARFAELYLAVPQADGLQALRMRAFMAPSNTGLPSGFDLDNDGSVTTSFPTPPGAKPDGSPGEQTADGRRYGNDCWGFGTFPGQYAMALLVDERLTILPDRIRTFQRLPWDYVTGNAMPEHAEGDNKGQPWYDDAERKLMRLSSKSHWDVPVMLPNGAVVHFLCSHPTPPAFDGPEMRNKKRNHDEIRFWADYLSNEAYIVDDRDTPGGLDRSAHAIILGDLNADPDEGSSFRKPITTVLAGVGKGRRLLMSPVPKADVPITGLDEDDTALFGLRVDYVIPSSSMQIAASGIWRRGFEIREAPDKNPKKRSAYPSDHFPVWAEIVVPAPIDPAPGVARGVVPGTNPGPGAPDKKANDPTTPEKK